MAMTDEEIHDQLASLIDSGDLVRVGETEFSMTELGQRRVNKLCVQNGVDPNDQAAVTQFILSHL